MGPSGMKSGEVIAAKYRLKHRLGVGGMGEVWAAQHNATGRDFAIKFMHAHVAASPQARQRFSREARASARINHPNIIDVFDVGELDDGCLYLVMELLDGVSLADAFFITPAISVRDFVSIMLDTSRALSAAHAAGIVHRDIKPGNIFLHRDRGSGLAYAKLLDFGISKFGSSEDDFNTKTGSVLGSPRYMSPEQARSAAAADHRADVWAMGVILFEGTVGTWPHEGDSFSSLVVAIATTQPASIDQVAPHLPDDLRSIVRDALLPLEQRMGSAGELAARLEAVLQNEALAALPLPRPHRSPGEERSFTTGGDLKVGLPSKSVRREHPSTTPPPLGPRVGESGLSTTPQPFGVVAATPGHEDAPAATARQPFEIREPASPSEVAAQRSTTPLPQMGGGATIPLAAVPLRTPGDPRTPYAPSAPPLSPTAHSPYPASVAAPTPHMHGGYSAPVAAPTPGMNQTMPMPGSMSGYPSGSPSLATPTPGFVLPHGHGVAPHDPLSGSVSSAATTVALIPGARGMAASPEAYSTMPSASTAQPAQPPSRRFGGPLGVAAAILAVAAVAIGVALFSVVQGGAQETGGAAPNAPASTGEATPPLPPPAPDPAPAPPIEGSAAPAEAHCPVLRARGRGAPTVDGHARSPHGDAAVGGTRRQTVEQPGLRQARVRLRQAERADQAADAQACRQRQDEGREARLRSRLSARAGRAVRDEGRVGRLASDDD
ncbi:MAG: protein kinase [Polyangiaceae bacterium]